VLCEILDGQQFVLSTCNLSSITAIFRVSAIGFFHIQGLSCAIRERVGHGPRQGDDGQDSTQYTHIYRHITCVKSDHTYIGYMYHAEKKAICITAKASCPIEQPGRRAPMYLPFVCAFCLPLWNGIRVEKTFTC
jgi:hypothetical protein